MTISSQGRFAITLLFGFYCLTVAAVYGQAPGASGTNPPARSSDREKSGEEAPRRWSIGLRVRTLPVRSFSVMDNGRAMNTTTISKTVYDLNYTTTSKSFLLGGGIAFEAPITRRTVLSAELIFNRLRYDGVLDEYWGTDDPNTSNDERSHLNAKESTKARLFDLPVLLHRNLGTSGFLSHVYLSAGATARNVSAVRTTNNLTNADGTLANNQIQAPISKRTLIGGTVGIGFRFIDEFSIKVTPEVRYTRWNAETFSLNSTQSPRNQLEVGIGFTR
jgi:hypothetical protein